MKRDVAAALAGLIASAALGLPAHSEDRPTVRTAQRGTPATPQQTPAPAQPGSAPQPAAPPPPQPVRTEIVAHDNWTVTCREFTDKRRTCSGTLQVVQSQNNQVLFAWIIGKGGDNRLVSILQTPTGVVLAPGVEVKLARGPTRKATFVNCDNARCEATLDLDDAFSRDAAASENVEATLYGTNGQGVKFTLPFKGFDRALAAVR